MNSIAKQICCCFLLILFAIGCTSTGTMTKNIISNKGLSHEYPVDFKTAYDLAKHACVVLDFEIEEESTDRKYIIVENGMSHFSWGERIGIYFKDIEPRVTRIRILSLAKIRTNILAPKWEEELHLNIRRRLDQLQAEGLIPA